MILLLPFLHCMFWRGFLYTHFSKGKEKQQKSQSIIAPLSGQMHTTATVDCNIVYLTLNDKNYNCLFVHSKTELAIQSAPNLHFSWRSKQRLPTTHKRTFQLGLQTKVSQQNCFKLEGNFVICCIWDTGYPLIQDWATKLEKIGSTSKTVLYLHMRWYFIRHICMTYSQICSLHLNSPQWAAAVQHPGTRSTSLVVHLHKPWDGA